MEFYTSDKERPKLGLLPKIFWTQIVIFRPLDSSLARWRIHIQMLHGNRMMVKPADIISMASVDWKLVKQSTEVSFSNHVTMLQECVVMMLNAFAIRSSKISNLDGIHSVHGEVSIFLSIQIRANLHIKGTMVQKLGTIAFNALVSAPVKAFTATIKNHTILTCF